MNLYSRTPDETVFITRKFFTDFNSDQSPAIEYAKLTENNTPSKLDKFGMNVNANANTKLLKRPS